MDNWDKGLAVVGAMVTALQFVIDVRPFKNFRVRLPIFLVLVGAGLYFAYKKTEESDTKESNQRAEIASLRKQVGTANRRQGVIQDNVDTTKTNTKDIKTQNDSLRDRLAHLQDDNYRLSRALTENTLEMQKRLMGYGDALFQLQKVPNQDNYQGKIDNPNNYNLFNLRLLVTDIDSLQKCKWGVAKDSSLVIDDECFYRYTQEAKLDAILRHTNAFVEYHLQSRAKIKRLLVKMNLLNVALLQQTYLYLEPGVCRMSYKLFRLTDNNWKLIRVTNEIPAFTPNWQRDFPPAKNFTIAPINDSPRN